MIWRSKPLALALVGCGNMGSVHAENVHRNKRCRLACVYDPEQERATQLAHNFSVPYVAQSFETILADPKIEGLIIATPHHLHFEQVMQALDGGKHVLIEKPMALDAMQARQMCEQAKETKRRLLVGQNMRFWPNVEKARQTIQAGLIGQLSHVIRRRMVYQRNAGRPWAHDPAKAGGWLLQGITVHEIDALIYMTGLGIEVVSVLATRSNPLWNDIDELAAVIRFDNGAIGSLSHTLNSHVSSLETTLIGKNGSIFLTDSHKGYALNGNIEFLGDNEGIGDELMDFVNAIRYDSESRVDADNILPTMIVLDKMRSLLL